MLITELAWLNRLGPDARNTLSSRASPAANWIALTDAKDGFAEQVAWQRAGVRQLFRKPLREERLAELIDRLHDQLDGPPLRVLLLDGADATFSRRAALLEQAGLVVQVLREPAHLPNAIAGFKPDLLLADGDPPGCTATELLVIVRQQENRVELPILFLNATAAAQELLTTRPLATDYLSGAIAPGLLLTAVRSRAQRFRARQRAYALRRTHLHATRERYKELYLALEAHAILSITDARGNIVHVNDRFCEISGYRREELIGHNHRLLKSGKHSPEFYQELWGTITHGNIWHGEVSNRRKDGTHYCVEATIVPVLNDKGRPVQYISIRTDITRLMQREAEVRTLAERFSRSQDYANIGTWDWNIQTGELYWSDRIASLFGHPAGILETSFANFLNAVHPDDRQAVRNAIDASIEHDTPYEIEHRVVWPDGQVRWLLERGAVARDTDGRPLHMLGVVQDIDDNKRTQLALARSEQRLREAQSLAHIGNWESDLTTGELFWSEEIFRIFGLDPASSVPSADSFHAAVHPDDLELVLASTRRSTKSGIHDLTHRILRPDGTVRYVDTLAYAERNADGRVVRLIGTTQDVTAAKTAERDLELFRRIFDASQHCIGIADSAERILYVNRSFEKALGYSFKELALRPAELVLPEVEQALSWREVMATLADSDRGLVQIPFRRKDGSFFTSLSNFGAVKDQHGQIQYYFDIFTDFTEELARRAELAEARETAERANDAKSEFLSSMSHELRTPMNAIIGFAQMLEYDNELNADQRDSAKEIRKAGDHLLDLINEVLDLAKIESGQVNLSLEPVPLGPLINDCQQLIQPLVTTQKLSLTVDVAPGATVRADRIRIRQALLNLLSNAVKYNREQGEIRVIAGPGAGNNLRIAVTDTGPGILPAHLTSLFEPFNRLGAEHTEVDGTGIGLTITRRLVELMGGSIGVHSEVGIGSTFWIDLPQSETAGREISIQSRSATQSPRTLAHQYQILCIDDNPANLKLIAQMLGRRGNVDLITAHTPALGIELALAHRPDLILLDINMPNLDGYQVLKIFTADAYLRSVPVIAITANAMPKDIARGMTAGFTEYLIKPLDLMLFLQTIDRHLAPVEQNQS
ncbi:MAG: PAS domain-containing protein [Porticoccaceae bacterium]